MEQDAEYLGPWQSRHTGDAQGGHAVKDTRVGVPVILSISSHLHVRETEVHGDFRCDFKASLSGVFKIKTISRCCGYFFN